MRLHQRFLNFNNNIPKNILCSARYVMTKTCVSDELLNQTDPSKIIRAGSIEAGSPRESPGGATVRRLLAAQRSSAGRSTDNQTMILTREEIAFLDVYCHEGT